MSRDKYGDDIFCNLLSRVSNWCKFQVHSICGSGDSTEGCTVHTRPHPCTLAMVKNMCTHEGLRLNPALLQMKCIIIILVT